MKKKIMRIEIRKWVQQCGFKYIFSAVKHTKMLKLTLFISSKIENRILELNFIDLIESIQRQSIFMVGSRDIREIILFYTILGGN